MQQKTTKSASKGSDSRKSVLKQKKEITFPFDKQNVLIICSGIVVIVIGYILMAQDSVNGFVPTSVAPVVLLLGYCVIIPFGILKRAKKPAAAQSAQASAEPAAQTTAAAAASVSSNIKTKS